MDVLEMKDMNGDNKGIFDFFKQLNIKDVQKLVVTPKQNIYGCSTYFHFKIENKYEFVFYYYKNEKVREVNVEDKNNLLFLEDPNSHEEWIKHIWEQFVDYFHLRIRLMFIDEYVPWKWNKEFTY